MPRIDFRLSSVKVQLSHPPKIHFKSEYSGEPHRLIGRMKLSLVIVILRLLLSLVLPNIYLTLGFEISVEAKRLVSMKSVFCRVGNNEALRQARSR